MVTRLSKITSRRNPLVARFREVARGVDRTLLLLDGVHLIEGALDAGLAFPAVLVSADSSERNEIASLVSRIRGRQEEVTIASSSVMDAVSPVRTASDIVALAVRPAAVDERVYDAPGPVVVAADIQDPGNVGAIVRVAEAGGAAGVVVAGVSANPFGWKALRRSMASALRLPISVAPDLRTAVAAARAHDRRIIATVARGGAVYDREDLATRAAILIGGEASGLPRETIETADARVTIPMAAGVESLNAAVAAAILVYEARRQRTTSKSEGDVRG